MEIKTLWWLIRPTKRGKSDRIEVRNRFGTLIPGKISKDDPTKFYPSNGSVFHRLRSNGTTDEGASWSRIDGVKSMSNSFIVNSTIDMMDAGDMAEKWVPISKNTFKFADITVDPEGITFDNQQFKMSFMQRMKFLRAYGALQEYYAVKKFRDSIIKAGASTVVLTYEESKARGLT